MDITLNGERIVIAGGSGAIGRALGRHLGGLGARVVVLSRSEPDWEGREPAAWEHVRWDGRTAGAWAGCLEGARGVVNVVGRTVDCIKTPEHCDEILRSRVEATRALGEALRGCVVRPGVWVQMSTAHIYGDPPEAVCEEGSALGYGLAPEVGKAWEGAFAAGLVEGVRGVVLRTSFVLGRRGGALGRLGMLAKLGLGGKVGHGRQGMSWIHEEDLCRVFERGLVDEGMKGVYIASAPTPVSNAEFTRTLRRAVGMPVGLPCAAWMVRIGARLVLRTDPELALQGRYVVPRRLMEEGFVFRFGELRAALADLYGRE